MAELSFLPQLGLAVLLSLVVGMEREFRQKQAGIRTHVLVGLGAAVFMVVSIIQFGDSRIAAQIVSGVGFLGAGLIFVRRDMVRGLTTAASVWLVAAIGMAAGAGLFILAPAITAGYLLVTLVIKPLTRRMPHARSTRHTLMIRYQDGRGLLRTIIAAIAEHGMKVSNLQVRDSSIDPATQEIILQIDGSPNATDAAVVALNRIPGVLKIRLNAKPDGG